MQTELFLQGIMFLLSLTPLGGGICNVDSCFYMVLNFTIQYAMLMWV